MRKNKIFLKLNKNQLLRETIARSKVQKRMRYDTLKITEMIEKQSFHIFRRRPIQFPWCFWTLESRPWTLESRPWTLDLGIETLDLGIWTLDLAVFLHLARAGESEVLSLLLQQYHPSSPLPSSPLLSSTPAVHSCFPLLPAFPFLLPTASDLL